MKTIITKLIANIELIFLILGASSILYFGIKCIIAATKLTYNI